MSPNTHRTSIPSNYRVEPERLRKVRQKLEAAGVRHCFSLFVDIHGVPKAKTNPLSAFEKMAHGSELFTVGAMDGMGLVGPHEDECAAVPDLDTMVICPWDKTKAFFFGDLYYHGLPYPNDSRQILKRQLARAAEHGWRFQLGMEPEFYIFRPPESDTSPPQPVARIRYQSVCPAYDVHQTLQSFGFLERLSAALEELGWGLFSFDQEGGHGQFEFDCHYADALTMCDRFVFLRLMIKQLAEAEGLVASFMPKPFANDFRSGNHFNMSLASAESGANVFAPSPESNPLAERYGLAFSDMACHFTAGLLQHASGLAAITCPTYNSYQGLLAQGDMPDISWAPVLVAYGRNNRSAMLRLPMNRCCIENRAPDISVNPYLAAACLLAAGMDGIEQQLDPGPPLDENCYQLGTEELRRRGLRFLPRTLLEALEAMESDPLFGRTLGDDFLRIYSSWKMREWREGFYAVNPEHRARRLTFL